ncbi:MAG: leucyl aminopeptidase [Acidimicrobiales bacterium]
MPLTCSAASDVPAGTDALAVPVFSGLVVAGGAPVEVDTGFCRARGFSGKAGETLALQAGDGTTVVVVGLGDEASVGAETLRRAAGRFVRAASRNQSGAFLLRGALPTGLPPAAAAQAVAEGAALAAYQFTTYKGEPEPTTLASVAVVGEAGGAGLDALAEGVARGAVVARAVALARDLVNEPAGAMTPRQLAEVAEGVAAERGLDVEVWDEATIEGEGLGGLAGVARGSDEPPRLIRLSYDPPASVTGGRDVPTVALVGKGITFDSGGLSLKTAAGMMTMKTDMGGAAAVLATLSAVRELEVPVRVLGFMPTTENMPGGRATKPGDVLKIRNGKTIEVLNTDAEGRLVLADGLSLAVEAGPDAIVDLATLTGACVAALGRSIAGVMGNHEGLVAQVRAASERAGEPTWTLPLPEEYRKQFESEVADMKNIGAPGQAGALVAGLILSEFVGDVPWAHLDIAGPARSEEDEGYLRKGATGFGVRTLLELLGAFERPAASG